MKDRVKLSLQLKTEVPPPLNANMFFKSHPLYDQTQGASVVLFSLLYR